MPGTPEVRFIYRLTGAGWSNSLLTIDPDSTQLTTSYLSDALGDLVAATTLLPRAESTIRVSWDEEPGEFRWGWSGPATNWRSGSSGSTTSGGQSPMIWANSCWPQPVHWLRSSARSRWQPDPCSTSGVRTATGSNGSNTSSRWMRSALSKMLYQLRAMSLTDAVDREDLAQQVPTLMSAHPQVGWHIHDFSGTEQLIVDLWLQQEPNGRGQKDLDAYGPRLNRGLEPHHAECRCRCSSFASRESFSASFRRADQGQRRRA